MIKLILIFFISFPFCYSDFVYKDFNDTTGIIFNGAAGTTNCYNMTSNAYGDVQGKADLFNINVLNEIGTSTVLISSSSVQTNLVENNNDTNENLAGFLNRPINAQAPTKCNVRARLTPSNPSKIGSIWFKDPAPVSNGFETYFTFQITDQSRQCTSNKDQYFSLKSYTTCSVHGADGFAFVIQNSNSTVSAIGGIGGQVGFGGIENSLAIVFDTWQNPGYDALFEDHISIQSRGSLKNDAFSSGLLGVPRPHTLADGNIHLAKITYYGDLKPQYFNKLIASDSLLPYLKDNGEQKRIGTLLVYIDEGIGTDTPLMALPINLSLLLDMPLDTAYVGFTSSTGRFYEKHDILSWVWCDQEPCSTPEKKEFDYHQESKFSSTPLREFTPGPGYGGGDTQGFPTKNTSPNTDPWSLPESSFSSSRNEGLSQDALQQIPPNTIY